MDGYGMVRYGLIDWLTLPAGRLGIPVLFHEYGAVGGSNNSSTTGMFKEEEKKRKKEDRNVLDAL